MIHIMFNPSSCTGHRNLLFVDIRAFSDLLPLVLTNITHLDSKVYISAFVSSIECKFRYGKHCFIYTYGSCRDFELSFHIL